jgi:NitT/TauT family transport system substrate-binding protein
MIKKLNFFALMGLAFVFCATAQAADVPVTVGATNAASDAPIYVADKKGYFSDEGLAVTVTNFRSAADMVAPLGTGELDAGAGSPSAGLYNAVLRGVRIKIVADKASSPPATGRPRLSAKISSTAAGTRMSKI